MKYLKQFVIPFSGLNEGEHWFDFKIDKQFFDCFEDHEVQEAEVEIKLCFIKRSTMLELNFEIEGTFQTNCDRCWKSVSIPIESQDRILVKFGDEQFDETDEILVIPYRETEIDISKIVYELIVVAMPMKRVHEEGKCDDSISDQLMADEDDNDKPTDPRWDLLKNLK